MSDDLNRKRDITQGEDRHAIPILGRLEKIVVVAGGEDEARRHSELAGRSPKKNFDGITEIGFFNPA